MTLANRFLQAWHSQEKTIAAKPLAKTIDEKVRILFDMNHYTNYYFSDGSTAYSFGRGNRFRLWTQN